jgi:hypothetical protein
MNSLLKLTSVISARVVALPIPLDPPITIATFPSNLSTFIHHLKAWFKNIKCLYVKDLRCIIS